MGPRATTEAFVDAVRASALVAPATLRDFLTAQEPRPRGPKAVARSMVRAGLLSRWQARQLLRGRTSRFLLGGKYRLLEPLGRGGYSRVYLCEHLILRRLVALKLLPRRLAAEDATAVERLRREARALSALEHPNIVRAVDVQSHGRRHFLVMEYVEGSSLQKIVQRRGPMAVGRAVHYAVQVARGLQNAHEAGWIHRDVKPGNVVVDRQGVAKLLDLGLALSAPDRAEGLTQRFDAGRVLGTADYLAPEQAVNSHEVDTRADVYGLGATLYFLLSGRPPFPVPTVTQKLLLLQTSDPEPLRTLRPEVPAELGAVVRRAMAKRPDERFATPGELAAALEPWTDASAAPPKDEEMPKRSACTARLVSPLVSRAFRAAARPVSAPRRKTRPRRRLFVATLLSVLILGTVGVVVGPRVGTEEGPGSETPHAVLEGAFRLQAGDGAFRTFATLNEAMAAARAGDRVVVTTNRIDETLRLAGPTRRNLTLEADPAWGPVVWTGGDADTPILDIDDAPGFRLNGPFVFDGRAKNRILVRLQNACAGARLDGAMFRNWVWAAVLLWNARGEAERPVTLARLRVVGSSEMEKVGVQVEGGEDEPGRHTCHTAVVDCHLEGFFPEGAFYICDQVTDLRLAGNRIFGARYGVAFVRRGSALRVEIANNTFMRCRYGLFYREAPEDSDQVRVRNNLFPDGGPPP